MILRPFMSTSPGGVFLLSDLPVSGILITWALGFCWALLQGRNVPGRRSYVFLLLDMPLSPPLEWTCVVFWLPRIQCPLLAEYRLLYPWHIVSWDWSETLWSPGQGIGSWPKSVRLDASSLDLKSWPQGQRDRLPFHLSTCVMTRHACFPFPHWIYKSLVAF